MGKAELTSRPFTQLEWRYGSRLEAEFADPDRPSLAIPSQQGACLEHIGTGPL